MRRRQRRSRPHTADQHTGDWGDAAKRPRALAAVTALNALALIAVAALALPGEPSKLGTTPLEILQRPTVLAPLAVATLIGLLWSLRMWAFRRHVRTPGPIRLVSFEDTTASAQPGLGSSSDDASRGGAAQPERVLGGATAVDSAPVGSGPSTIRLSMHLRDRLTELRLPVPSVIPGAKASTDFVELLGTTKFDLKQPFAAAGNLMRLIRPTHAYELKATILRRQEHPCCGVAIELTILPSGAAAFRTYWDDTHEHALNRAASGVGSRVVPHSRHAEIGPWCSWRGKQLSEDLFFAYQRAQRRVQQRRYDEALGEYYNALRLDPVNEHLRHELGHLQEERALHLDAWLTYHSIIASLDGRSREALDRIASRARRRILILTRYRFTILLGFGERLARQWLPPPRGVRPTRRSEALDQLRDQLRPILRELYLGRRAESISVADMTLLGLDETGTDHAADHDGMDGLDRLLSDSVPSREQPAAGEGLAKGARPTPEQIDAARKRWREEESRARSVRKAQLRLLFQLLAESEVQKLLDDIPDKDLERLDTGLSRTALDLLPPWAQLRTEHARILLRRALGESIAQDAWPPSSARIRGLWRERISRGSSLHDRLERSDVFLDHYNAACTFSIGLGHEHAEHLSEAARRDLAEAAVQALRRALNVADSAAIAANWDWVASKDPDLAGLRGQPEFRRFESERLPSSRPTPRRPNEIADLKASQHSVRLVKRCARVYEELWHARADLTGATNAHAAMQWCEEEQRGWELLRMLALHHRHWQTRVDVVAEVRALAEKHALPPVRFTQARYSDDPLDADDDSIDKVAGRVVWFANGRLAALVDALGPPDAPLPGLLEWSRQLRRLDDAGQELDEASRRRLAVQRASAWADVQHFMDQETAETDARAALRVGLDGLREVLRDG
ncbi:MAG: hypothetical protein QOJ63_65 [Solirubrobacteraceae bacterium]|jgi:hypothetical protein|nr:hypothetical protein [Solirubrobacteraceae bacterium]